MLFLGYNKLSLFEYRMIIECIHYICYVTLFVKERDEWPIPFIVGKRAMISHEPHQTQDENECVRTTICYRLSLKWFG
jgi:hypothetical protein